MIKKFEKYEKTIVILDMISLLMVIIGFVISTRKLNTFSCIITIVGILISIGTRLISKQLSTTL